MNNRQLIPVEVGGRETRGLYRDRFRAGFEHAMHGGQLDKVEYFRLSFREGFRAAKLHLRNLRRRQGVLDFPMRGRIKFKTG